VAAFTRTVHDIPLARIVDLVSTLRQLCVNSAPILRIHESTQENWAVVVSISSWNSHFL
jgi:hypothetical protein